MITSTQPQQLPSDHIYDVLNLLEVLLKFHLIQSHNDQLQPNLLNRYLVRLLIQDFLAPLFR